MKGAVASSGLSSLWDMIVDVRQAIEGEWGAFDRIRRSVEKTDDHLLASDHSSVPKIGDGIWAALGDIVERLDEVEWRLEEAEWYLACREMDADWARSAIYDIRAYLNSQIPLPPDPEYPERPERPEPEAPPSGGGGGTGEDFPGEEFPWGGAAPGESTPQEPEQPAPGEAP